jgi:hypothetical protein
MVSFRTQLHFNTGVQHVTGVLVATLDTQLRTGSDVHEEVTGVLAIPVEADGQTVVEHAQIETGIHLLVDFPVQTGVGDFGRTGTVSQRALTRGILIPLGVQGDAGLVRIVSQDVHITVTTPGSTELEEVDEVVITRCS